MIRKLAMFGALLCAGTPASAGDLKIALKCTLPVVANRALRVDVALENNNCDSAITLDSLMVGLAGNGSGALALIGPFKRTFTPAIVVPKAICGARRRPGKAARRIVVTNSTPADFAGTMALVFVEGLDARGAGSFGSQCFAEITP